MNILPAVFLDFSIRKLRQFSSRIEDSLGLLTNEQIWAREGDTQNAVGNLVLHLSGNVRQWIISGVGRMPDIRHRDAEFAARDGQPAAELSELLRRTVAEATAVLEALPAERLAESVEIQTYQLTVLEAIYSVVEHFSGHTGQILFATKLLTGKDLGYYRHLAGMHTERTP